METWSEKINEQVEKLSYLDAKKEKNMETLLNRIREIEEEKQKTKTTAKLNSAAIIL